MFNPGAIFFTRQCSAKWAMRSIVRRYLVSKSALKLPEKFKLSGPQQVRSWHQLAHRNCDEALRPKPKGQLPGSTKESANSVEQLRQENTRMKAESAYWKNSVL